ncbi:hypothetical protein Nepgr_019108 [Nepenthes gracilis]|uniref:Uncharacterized protein n=1 Tax=Nepenthes gracilis TaxID=150966 RepID=A0AAD3SV88_NEPGR|nr:hypothetical protein Nepgr_019108 [Nepenthes gracilis]
MYFLAQRSIHYVSELLYFLTLSLRSDYNLVWDLTSLVKLKLGILHTYPDWQHFLGRFGCWDHFCEGSAASHTAD